VSREVLPAKAHIHIGCIFQNGKLIRAYDLYGRFFIVDIVHVKTEGLRGDRTYYQKLISAVGCDGEIRLIGVNAP